MDQEPELTSTTPITPPMGEPLVDRGKTQALIDEYNRAVEQEFNIEADPTLEDPEEIAQRARKKLIALVPQAINKLADLLTAGGTQQIQMAAAKFIIQAAFDKKLITSDESLNDLFRKLQLDDNDNSDTANVTADLKHKNK